MSSNLTLQERLDKSPLKDPRSKAIYAVLQSGIPLYKTRGLTSEQMENYYALAYNLYSGEKYKEAGKIFDAITFFNHLDTKSWLGAAGCAEMLKNYEKALIAYSHAAVLELNNPLPALHAFDCHIALKNYPQAMAALDSVILRSANKPEYAAISEKAESLRSMLHKTIQDSKKAI